VLRGRFADEGRLVVWVVSRRRAGWGRKRIGGMEMQKPRKYIPRE
jgi:hypothetical protein